MPDSRRLDIVAIWVGYLASTVLWVLLAMAGSRLTVTRGVFMVLAAVVSLGALVRALRLKRT